jgi:hypothetical protein
VALGFDKIDALGPPEYSNSACPGAARRRRVRRFGTPHYEKLAVGGSCHVNNFRAVRRECRKTGRYSIRLKVPIL